ncbi:hypothetical protein [Mycobacterium ostraviense]|uniref:Uncharacterized protein n=1 Tax=Mycobacterium ostraviense TaxID=2738409 RepID=A0A163YMK3_9MYCO|nr:hypothetical protein [Mycobacterium ostraviense]KZS60584.1 hypothetical protein A4G28_01775 [Mycobacterium ostraviense]UGT93433.1 hypothetical protein LTS72_09235 [Mycobacterium ostraviense]
MHAGLKSASAVFAVLGVLAGAGVLTRGAPVSAPTATLVTGIATTEAVAEPLTPTEQQVVRLLPAGYSAGSCMRATHPFPAAIASLDCTDDLQSDTPDYARFTLYDNVDSLTADFYATAESMAVSPCPGGNASPGSWDYGSSRAVPAARSYAAASRTVLISPGPATLSCCWPRSTAGAASTTCTGGGCAMAALELPSAVTRRQPL